MYALQHHVYADNAHSRNDRSAVADYWLWASAATQPAHHRPQPAAAHRQWHYPLKESNYTLSGKSPFSHSQHTPYSTLPNNGPFRNNSVIHLRTPIDRHIQPLLHPTYIPYTQHKTSSISSNVVNFLQFDLVYATIVAHTNTAGTTNTTLTGTCPYSMSPTIMPATSTMAMRRNGYIWVFIG